MTTSPKAAFKFDGVMVKLDKLLPGKKVRDDLRHTSAYKTIVASIGEIGIIEPPMVYPAGNGKYLLVDGQSRVEALKDLKIDEVFCLIAADDETYTYNRQRIHVAPIQANKMLLKAIEIGVSEERIAKTLNLSPTTIHNSRSLLQGICREAVELLKDKHVPRSTLQELKKVKAMRQIVMAELMTASGTYAAPYAQALVATSKPEELVEDRKLGKAARTKAQDLARIEYEMRALEKDFLLREDTYGRTVLELTLARAYLKKLLDNGRVVRYLAQKYRDLLAEFQRIVETTALDKLNAG
jgi:ParB-like chromosome segregation protein Spo0J